MFRLVTAMMPTFLYFYLCFNYMHEPENGHFPKRRLSESTMHPTQFSLLSATVGSSIFSCKEKIARWFRTLIGVLEMRMSIIQPCVLLLGGGWTFECSIASK